jgi:hypothetical protein
MLNVAAAIHSQLALHMVKTNCLLMFAQNVTLFTLASRKFLTLPVKLTNSTNALVTNLSLSIITSWIHHMMFAKKDAPGRLFLCPGMGGMSQ